MQPLEIVVTCSTAQKARRDKLAGICRVARKYGWRLHIVDGHPYSPTLNEVLAKIEPDGFILESPSAAVLPESAIRSEALARVPHVFMDADPALGERDNVLLDFASVAKCAADCLVPLGCASYAYVGVPDRPFWCLLREAAFIRELRARGIAAKSFRGNPSPGRTRRNAAALRAFLRGLPKPCAVFAAFDAIARETADACAAAGLRVPDDVVVLGCDDDPIVCENNYPTISSVLPDWHRCGEIAAELLWRRIERKSARGVALKYGAIRVSVRDSTRLLPVRSAEVGRALGFIAENARSGISAADVAVATGMPLRTMEYRFRRELGKSPSDAIADIRLEAVQRMLLNPDVRIGAIAQMCGYRSDIALKAAFRRHFGCSMSGWRRRMGVGIQVSRS